MRPLIQLIKVLMTKFVSSVIEGQRFIISAIAHYVHCGKVLNLETITSCGFIMSQALKCHYTIYLTVPHATLGCDTESLGCTVVR